MQNVTILQEFNHITNVENKYSFIEGNTRKSADISYFGMDTVCHTKAKEIVHKYIL